MTATAPPERESPLLIAEYPVHRLRFDALNPRLAGTEPPPRTQDEIAAALRNAGGAADIALALRDGTYIRQAEPFITVLENGHEVVIDGNRRLLALKCPEQPDRSRLPTRVSVLRFPGRAAAGALQTMRNLHTQRRWRSPMLAARVKQALQRNPDQEAAAQELGLHLQTVKPILETMAIYAQFAPTPDPRFTPGEIQQRLHIALMHDSVRRQFGLSEWKPDAAAIPCHPAPPESIDSGRRVIAMLASDSVRDIGDVETLAKLYDVPAVHDRLQPGAPLDRLLTESSAGAATNQPAP